MSVLGNFTTNNDRTTLYSGSGGPVGRTSSRQYYREYEHDPESREGDRRMNLGRRMSSMMGFGQSSATPSSPPPSNGAPQLAHPPAPNSAPAATPEMPTTMRRYGTSGPEEPSAIMRRTSSDTLAPLSGPSKNYNAKTAAQPPAYKPDVGGPRTEEDVAQDITQLARSMSRQVSRAPTTNTAGGARGNVFDYESGSDLDPYSKTFDAKKWVRSLQATAEEDEGTRQRNSGVAFKGMGVHGFGSDAGTFSTLHQHQRVTGHWQLGSDQDDNS